MVQPGGRQALYLALLAKGGGEGGEVTGLLDEEGLGLGAVFFSFPCFDDLLKRGRVFGAFF